MLSFIINNSSNEGSLILDCFAGSFSTITTAAKFNRKFVGIDCLDLAITIGKKRLEEANIKYNFYKIKE
jgi:adenine-specific DNA-methyltransferase